MQLLMRSGFPIGFETVYELLQALCCGFAAAFLENRHALVGGKRNGA
jgi:hypothetical protein